MRFQARSAWAAGAAIALTLTLLSCNGSDSVTNPAPSMAASANLAGSWTGTFQANTAGCSSPVTATLQQSGTSVTGLLAADKCGIHGAFFGTLSGNSLSGKVEMSGCKAGAVLGRATGSTVVMTLGDFLSLSDFGDKVLMYGGAVTLQK